MQFPILLAAFFVTLTASAPTALQDRSFFGDIGSDISSAASDVVSGVKAAGSEVGKVVSDLSHCDILQCAAALGPVAVSCGGAVAKFVKSNPEVVTAAEDAAEVAKRAGSDTASSSSGSTSSGTKAAAAGCLAGVVNDVENTPSSCKTCF